MEILFGLLVIGYVCYLMVGIKVVIVICDVQLFFGEFVMGGCVVVYNGNIINVMVLCCELIECGLIFQFFSDSECIIYLMVWLIQCNIFEWMKDVLCCVEGVFSVIVMICIKLFGVCDFFGVCLLVLGWIGDDGFVLVLEICVLDIIGVEFVWEIELGEMVVILQGKVESLCFFGFLIGWFCIFEYVYFLCFDLIIGGCLVYEICCQIGVELVCEVLIEVDLVCLVFDLGIFVVIGYVYESGIFFGMGIICNQYMGWIFIELIEQICNMGVWLKFNVNCVFVVGKCVVLVDDFVVCGIILCKIKDMIFDVGVVEVYFCIVSLLMVWFCFYGVDIFDCEKLLVVQMFEEEMCDWIGVDSLVFVLLDGLYCVVGEVKGCNNFCL